VPESVDGSDLKSADL